MKPGERIRADIEGRIRSGEWKPGDRIPFEYELVKSYGCSRATVSKALEMLARAGLIERRRKAGSFVAHPRVHSAVLEVPDLAKVVAERGLAYRWQRLKREVEDGSVVVTGLHHAGDEPYCIEQREISLAAVPEAEAETFADEAPGTWLLKRVPWSEARHRISAVMPTAAEARLLGIPRTACLRIERWTWRGGDPVTSVSQLFPGDRHDLVADFAPGA